MDQAVANSETDVNEKDAQSLLKCPGCGAVLRLAGLATWAPETVTVAYKLNPGARMGASEFCGALAAYADLLEQTAQRFGVKVQVGIVGLSAADSEVSATLSVDPIIGQ